MLPRYPARIGAMALRFLLLAGAACVAPREGGELEGDLEPHFQHALEQLGRAVAADDDAVARRILGGILARRPTGRALELALEFDAVLDGRDLARDLVLELRVESSGDAQNPSHQLSLVCRSPATLPIRLDLPPPTLEQVTTWAFAAGTEQRMVENRTLYEFPGAVVPPGTDLVLDLGGHAAPLRNAIARRDHWRMTTRSGTVQLGERSLPLRAPVVRSCEAVALAPFLPGGTVEPEVLVEYVRRETIALPPLMERAVRIAPSRGSEAIALIAGIVSELDDERLSTIAPALRWLSHTARLGADPRAWRRALESGGADVVSVPGLDLPDRTR